MILRHRVGSKQLEDCADTLQDFSYAVLAMDKKNVGRKEVHVRSYRPWMFDSAISMGYFLRGLQLARRHDIVHVHLPNYLSCLILLFLRRDKKVVLRWYSMCLTSDLPLCSGLWRSGY